MSEGISENYKVYKHTLPVDVSGKQNDMVYIGITRKKMSISHIGVKKSDETRKKFSYAKSIPVVCVETGVVYKSAYEARDILGIDNSTISKCCRGVNKTAGKLDDGTKLHWEYYKEVA